MESVLIFLAIIVIQIIAAYSKQKKAAKRKQYEETAPIPWNLPHTEEELEELEEPEEFEEHEEYEEPVLEGAHPSKEKIEPEPKDLLQVQKLKTHQAININNPGQGILWAAILQEPRYKVKWKRR